VSVQGFCERVRQGLETATFAQRRQLVELLIDRVVVTDDEVVIRYVIPTSPRGEQTRFYQLRINPWRRLTRTDKQTSRYSRRRSSKEARRGGMRR